MLLSRLRYFLILYYNSWQTFRGIIYNGPAVFWQFYTILLQRKYRFIASNQSTGCLVRWVNNEHEKAGYLGDRCYYVNDNTSTQFIRTIFVILESVATCSEYALLLMHYIQNAFHNWDNDASIIWSYQFETFSVSKTLTLSQKQPFVCQKWMLLPEHSSPF